MSDVQNPPEFVKMTGPNDHELFKKHVTRALQAHLRGPKPVLGASIDVRDSYKGMQMYMTPDKKAGYAITDKGALISVFKHPTSTNTGVAETAARQALANGATHLSTWDPKLPELYMRGGFTPVGRMKFDPNDLSDNWDIKTMGTPDVVFMSAKSDAHKPESEPYKTGVAPETHDYDAGMESAKSEGEKNRFGGKTVRSRIAELRTGLRK
jgi:hypothetical protein